MTSDADTIFDPYVLSAKFIGYLVFIIGAVFLPIYTFSLYYYDTNNHHVTNFVLEGGKSGKKMKVSIIFFGGFLRKVLVAFTFIPLYEDQIISSFFALGILLIEIGLLLMMFDSTYY